MDVAYWNRVAEKYESEIFSVLAHDKNDRIKSLIEHCASPSKTASDMGCGIGKFLPILSLNFGRVYAYDLSEKCLDQARRSCASFPNIEYIRSDLSLQDIRMPKVDFALCVNSLIMPSLSKRSRYFRTISNHLNDGGHVVLVVPSFESATYCSIRLIEWNRRRGFNYGASVMMVWNGNSRQKASHLQQGIVNIDHVPTKHYLKEELYSIFQTIGLELHEIVKLEYPWKTEFSNPPAWMKEPYPWDWLVTAQKPKGG